MQLNHNHSLDFNLAEANALHAVSILYSVVQSTVYTSHTIASIRLWTHTSNRVDMDSWLWQRMSLNCSIHRCGWCCHRNTRIFQTEIAISIEQYYSRLSSWKCAQEKKITPTTGRVNAKRSVRTSWRTETSKWKLHCNIWILDIRCSIMLTVNWLHRFQQQCEATEELHRCSANQRSRTIKSRDFLSRRFSFRNEKSRRVKAET